MGGCRVQRAPRTAALGAHRSFLAVRPQPPHPLSLQLSMAETRDKVIVHHSHGLHIRVADRTANEFETTPFQLFAHGVRLRRLGGDSLHRFPCVLPRLTVDESPDVLVEAAEFLLYGQERFGILDGGFDLQPITNDPRIRQIARLVSSRCYR